MQEQSRDLWGKGRRGQFTAANSSLANLKAQNGRVQGHIFTFNIRGQTAYGIRYDYTQRNQLAHIYGLNWEPWFNYSYDPAGNMTKRQDVNGGVNDSLNVTSPWCDALDRPFIWENTQRQDAFLGRSYYQYDNLGREVTTWRDEEASKGERFEYNLRGQLIKATYRADQAWTSNPQNPLGGVENFSVNSLNRQSVTRNGITTGYTPNALNQYTTIGGQTLDYDWNFNLKSFDGATFTHNAQNQLVSASKAGKTVQFLYDGLGRCVRRTVNGVGTSIAYDGWKPVVERDLSGNTKAVNVYGAGPDEILWRSVTGVGDFRYHHDARGNVMFVLDGGGYLVEKYSYDAFGRPRIMDWNGNERTQTAIGNCFLFQGREWIPELGIYDYRRRAYHPGLGRFLQTDPLGLQTEGEKLSVGQKALFSPGGVAPETFSSSEMNLYRYCGDDPIGRSDPAGLDYVLLNDSDGAYGVGHSAALVGNDRDGWTYYNKNGAIGSSRLIFSTFDRFQQDKISSRYDRGLRIPRTPEQDNAMKDYGDKNYDKNITT